MNHQQPTIMIKHDNQPLMIHQLLTINRQLPWVKLLVNHEFSIASAMNLAFLPVPPLPFRPASVPAQEGVQRGRPERSSAETKGDDWSKQSRLMVVQWLISCLSNGLSLVVDCFFVGRGYWLINGWSCGSLMVHQWMINFNGWWMINWWLIHPKSMAGEWLISWPRWLSNGWLRVGEWSIDGW